MPSSARWGAAPAAIVLAVAAPAHAQQGGEAEIQALLDASDTPEGALALARLQAGEGDLIGAAAILERALLNHGEAETAAVRLYYVTILCRLDDRASAQAELDKLEGVDVRMKEWAETRAACGYVPRISRGAAPRRAAFNAELAAGLAYDSDLAGTLLVQFDVPGFVTPGDDGFSAIASLQADGRARVGSGFVYGSASAVSKDSLGGPAVDYQIADLELGAGLGGRGVEGSAGAVLRHAVILGERFVTEIGAAAEIAVMPGAQDRLSLRGEVVRQDYAGATAAFSRSGTRFDLALGYQGRTGDTGSFSLSAAYERKTSETARTGYAGGRLVGTLRQAIGSAGLYGTLIGTVRHVKYVDEVSFAEVSETRWFARSALGLPLGVAGLDVEAAASFSARDYNRGSFILDYHSVGGELRLVWAFGK